MTQVIFIALVVVLIVHDGFPVFPVLDPGPRGALLLAVLPLAAVCAAAWLVTAWCCRRLDARGNPRIVLLADRAMSLSRVAVLIVHAAAVLLFGWLDTVRWAIGGNMVLVDEAAALMPAVGSIVFGWWCYASIDRRLREAVLIRSLDEGAPVHRSPTRAGFVLDQVRHHALLVLVPLACIGAWTEAMDRLTGSGRPAWIDASLWEPVAGALQFLGVLVVLVLAPLVPRYLWDTTPLGTGPMRDRLEALCRKQGVRCRNILVWRTHGGMLNGAVIGLAPSLRYILLTDALLEELGEREIEAVMAHEVAHARRHHIPWLMATMIASIGLTWAALTYASLAATAWLAPAASGPAEPLMLVLSLSASIAAGLMIVGFVSRRFEWQADAFAVQHLSGLRDASGKPRTTLIEPEAVTAMAGALGAVAALNHIPPGRFSWRHGSIAHRQKLLYDLIGRDANTLTIDRVAAAIKIAAAIGVLAFIALVAFDPSIAAS